MFSLLRCFIGEMCSFFSMWLCFFVLIVGRVRRKLVMCIEFLIELGLVDVWCRMVCGVIMCIVRLCLIDVFVW